MRPVPRRKNSGQTLDCTRASTIGKISAQPQLRAGPPDGEDGPSARLQKALDVLHGGHRLGKVHQTQRTGDEVEACIGKHVEPLGVGAKGFDVGDAAAARFSLNMFDHAFGNVGGDHATLAPHGFGQREGHKPGAAGDVEDVLAGPGIGHREKLGLRVREAVFPACLVAPGRLVPSITLDAPLKSLIHHASPCCAISTRVSTHWGRASTSMIGLYFSDLRTTSSTTFGSAAE